MMRALWTSSSGMKAMQFNVDTIANNLANVNTTAFKKERAEFEDLLYVTMERAYMMENRGRPVNLQVGHGVVAKSISRVLQKEACSIQKTRWILLLSVTGFSASDMPMGTYTIPGMEASSFLYQMKEICLQHQEGIRFWTRTGNQFILISRWNRWWYRNKEKSATGMKKALLFLQARG
jgi:flagellar basal body rod protein FlgG